jgi:allantoicase
VLSFSDEFFAEAANLINPAAPIRKPGYFVETGAWYDGWETRRHNSEPADWVIIKVCSFSSPYINIPSDWMF